jgi:hypothetical protein
MCILLWQPGAEGAGSKNEKLSASDITFQQTKRAASGGLNISVQGTSERAVLWVLRVAPPASRPKRGCV